VTIEQIVHSLAVSPPTSVLAALGDTVRLEANAYDAGGRTIEDAAISWASSDSTVAAVSLDGLVEAISNGTATIAATHGSSSATASVTIEQVTHSLEVSPPTSTLAALGRTTTLAATVLDAQGAVMASAIAAWTSSDPSVATVSESGVVTALAEGGVTITATHGDVSGTATIDVRLAPNPLSGVLNANTVLTPEGGPYWVDGDILVPSDVTLTVEPGVTVLFRGSYYVKVEGTLTAIGTEADSIRFTSALSQPQAGDWSRIWFTDASADATLDRDGRFVGGSGIAYAEISYGGQIQFDASSPYFAHNHVHHVTGTPPRDWPNGAVWTCNSSAVIRDNLIEDNPITGIYVGGGDVQIRRNTIRRNRGSWGGGIFFANPNCADSMDSYADPVVEDNEITENTAPFGGGIALYSGSPIITHNDITNNVTTGQQYTGQNAQSGGAAIVTFSGGAPQITYNNIEGNSSTASGETSAIFLSWSFTGTIQHNNFDNPTTYAIYLNSNVTNDVEAVSNYWGTVSSAEIDARIWDFGDDFELGQVRYLPILQTRETSAGPR
jgi:hypothetical protein